MELVVFSAVLPLVVAVVMFGLGLELVGADFRRLMAAPGALLVVLACQAMLLPALGLALILVLKLPAPLALGVVVLLGSPGGAMAAVFSRLAGGNVAFNITVTSINAVLSLVTLPVLIGISALVIDGAADQTVVVPPDKVVQLVIVVLAPAALGMVLRRRHPAAAIGLQKPVRVAAIVAVFLSILVAVGSQAAGFVHGLVAVGGLVTGLCVLALGIGYVVPRLLRWGRAEAVASSFELGIHNVALAIAVCVSVLGNERAAVVPAMYGAIMFGPATALAFSLSRSGRGRDRHGAHPASAD